MFNIHSFEKKLNRNKSMLERQSKHMKKQMVRHKKTEKLVKKYQKRINSYVLSQLDNPTGVHIYKTK